MQLALNLGMASRFVVETPLMWIDKAETWPLAERLGGLGLVELVRRETHSCYHGDREHFHDWGFGCGECPGLPTARRGLPALPSMGRLTLNMLLSFAQFEREITGEQIRDKVAASKRKGIWMAGAVPLGYRIEDRALHVVEQEAEFVRSLFRQYLEVGSVVRLKTALDAENLRSPVRMSGTGKRTGGVPISRGHLYWILSNPIYVGRLRHKGQIHDGLHPAIIDLETWDRVQTIKSLAIRESKSERSIRMTLSLAFISPRPGGSRDGGSASARVLHQAP